MSGPGYDASRQEKYELTAHERQNLTDKNNEAFIANLVHRPTVRTKVGKLIGCMSPSVALLCPPS